MAIKCEYMQYTFIKEYCTYIPSLLDQTNLKYPVQKDQAEARWQIIVQKSLNTKCRASRKKLRGKLWTVKKTRRLTIYNFYCFIYSKFGDFYTIVCHVTLIYYELTPPSGQNLLQLSIIDHNPHLLEQISCPQLVVSIYGQNLLKFYPHS